MPNGCMLNALVCKRKVSKAVAACLRCANQGPQMCPWVHKHRVFWQDMVQERVMMHNEFAPGCLLDALFTTAKSPRPWQHLYGALIKASSTLKWFHRCRLFARIWSRCAT